MMGKLRPNKSTRKFAHHPSKAYFMVLSEWWVNYVRIKVPENLTKSTFASIMIVYHIVHARSLTLSTPNLQCKMQNVKCRKISELWIIYSEFIWWI